MKVHRLKKTRVIKKLRRRQACGLCLQQHSSLELSRVEVKETNIHKHNKWTDDQRTATSEEQSPWVAAG